MKPARIVPLLLLLALAGWYFWPEELADAPTGLPAAGAGAAPAGLVTNWPASRIAEADAAPQRVPLTPLAPPLAAVTSLADARERGDERAPPIVRSSDGEQATPAELADPQAYGRYEARQHLRLLSAYVREADQAVPKLRADIERGRAAGIPPQQIAQAEEKARRIAALRAALLTEHPELLPR